MPNYQFVCENCGKRIEELVPIGTKTIKCPDCNKTCNKIITIPYFCIKGSCANPLPPINHTEKKKEEKEREVFSDWICKKCGYEIKDEFCLPSKMICPKCKTKMEQQFDKISYKLEYNPKTDICNWNHESSQYWSEVKKQRRQGKDVKGFNEM